MKDFPKINENERKVLVVLEDIYSNDEPGGYSFAPIVRRTKLEVKQVRRACRSLAKKGLAVFERVMWNDDGPAGAGYLATELGAALISHCDLCTKRNTYDYYVDDSGEQVFSMDKNARLIKECDEHYKQSPNRTPELLS